MAKLKPVLQWITVAVITLLVCELLARGFYFHKSAEYETGLGYLFSQISQVGSEQIERRTKIGIHQRDDRYGYSHIANSTGVHRSKEFQVTYNIDSNQNRITPDAASPKGRILFLGGSYTFGQGVEDAQNFPYLLGEKWSEWKIQNAAVMGWGTVHAYLKLQDELNNRPVPAIVIYGFIPHHVKRNYLRKGWVRNLERYDRGHPHLEIIDDKLEFQGVIDGSSEVLDDVGNLKDKEREITYKLITEMAKMCRKYQVPFYVAILTDRLGYSTSRFLVENEINVIDLSGVKIKGRQDDPHPIASDHARIAEFFFSQSLDNLLNPN